ncbi:MAG: NAD-dependent epimerase/dehydratase family protein [Planctomycetaceae bacterium]
MRTAFVTGGTGFIGRHLVDTLLDRGVEVRCLVRAPHRAAHLQRDGIRLVAGSLADVSAWQADLAGCDAVFNAGGLVAACSHDELFAVNGRAAGALADACAAQGSPPTLVHVSSLAAAGPPPVGKSVRDETDPFAPVSAYGASKLLGDGELRTRADRLPVTCVQPGIVFGPHDRQVLTLYQMIAVARLHLPMGFRPVPMSLIHVADLVALLLAAADRGERMQPARSDAHASSGVFHACDDREHPTYGDLGRRIGRAIGCGVLVMPVAVPVAWPIVRISAAVSNLLGTPSMISPDKLREATARSWAASSAKARVQLGFAPAAGIDERLRQTGDWFRANGLL